MIEMPPLTAETSFHVALDPGHARRGSDGEAVHVAGWQLLDTGEIVTVDTAMSPRVFARLEELTSLAAAELMMALQFHRPGRDPYEASVWQFRGSLQSCHRLEIHAVEGLDRVVLEETGPRFVTAFRVTPDAASV